MELSDRVFVTNRDWDPQYLREIAMQDFYDFTEHYVLSIMACFKQSLICLCLAFVSNINMNFETANDVNLSQMVLFLLREQCENDVILLDYTHRYFLYF